MEKSVILRILTAILALYGAYAAFTISQLHMSGAEACPTLGPIPACYLVLAGYLAMLLAAIRPMKRLFIIGWLPVFLLASSGVAGEILSDSPVCPQTLAGFPKCYFSFALASVLAALGIALFRLDPRLYSEGADR